MFAPEQKEKHNETTREQWNGQKSGGNNSPSGQGDCAGVFYICAAGAAACEPMAGFFHEAGAGAPNGLFLLAAVGMAILTGCAALWLRSGKLRGFFE